MHVHAYTFDQLEPRAQQKARERAQDYLWRTATVDDLADEWRRKLAALGYQDPRLMYSFSHCQGDGACFTAKPDLHKIAERARLGLGSDLERALGRYTEAHLEAVLNGGYASMIHRGNYCHHRSVEVSLALESWPEDVEEPVVMALEAELLAFLEAEHERLALEFEAEGYAQLDAQTSDEALREHLAQLEFDEDGDEL